MQESQFRRWRDVVVLVYVDSERHEKFEFSFKIGNKFSAGFHNIKT